MLLNLVTAAGLLLPIGVPALGRSNRSGWAGLGLVVVVAATIIGAVVLQHIVTIGTRHERRSSASSDVGCIVISARNIHIWSQCLHLRIDSLRLKIIVVLPRVDSLPAQTLEHVPKARSKQRTEDWT